MIAAVYRPTTFMPVKAQGQKMAGSSGFTLIELLVSLVVMSILASLALSGMLVARSRAKAARTISTIRKISEIILPFYEQYETRRPSIDPTTTAQLLGAPNGRAKYAIAKQVALRRLMTLELPERIYDVGVTKSGTVPITAWNGNIDGTSFTLTETPPTGRRFQSIISSDGSKIGQWDGGELLHLIVMRGPVADPDIISHFRNDEIGDSDGDGLYEFVDGWNRGINFKRWPIGFASPMQPIDGTSRNIEQLVSKNGHRLVPLIYSAGPDGEFDVDEMTSLVYGNPNAKYGSSAVNVDSFDPFAVDSSFQSLAADPEKPGSNATAPAVVLVPVVRASNGPVTFLAVRAGDAIPGTVDGSTTKPQAAFQTVGSMTGNAALDNITNHDLTR